MRQLPRSGLALVLWISLSSLALGGPPEPAKVVPDPNGGVIDEKAAIAVMPVRYDKGSDRPEALDPSGLEAHLTPQDEPDVELVHPCGAWFQAPPKRYRFWIQGGWRISPYAMVLVHTPSKGPGITGVVPVGDAGRVVLPPKDQADPDLVVDLLSAGSYREGNSLRWEISPRRAADQVGDGVAMPAGKAIAALWDRRTRKYVALSRPFEVLARKTLEVPLERPAAVADLVVEARRHAPASTVADDDVAVSLWRNAKALPPDLKVSTADKIYSVWYGLAPGPGEVRVQSKRESLAPQPVNLSAGGIERLTVQLKPRAMVRGTVYRGDQANPARLTFTTTAQKTIKVRTDENGAYEVVLVDPLRQVAIELDGVKGGPYTEFFSPVITEAQVLDLHVPKAEPRLKVVDAATGEGIPQAAVTARNIFYPPDVTEEDAEARKTVVSLQLVTDATGWAWLPPLHHGSLELQATAEGYLPMPQPVEERVESPGQGFELPLEPVGETVALRLRLASGEPAAGADVSLVDSLASGASLFNDHANGEGLVHAPRKQSGVLLVKHPAAGFLVRDWQPQSGDEESEWVLPAPAGQPFTIQVVDTTERNAVPDAELALWVQDHRLIGAALAWLTGTSPRADNIGQWTAANLPRGPVAVLAWGPRLRDEVWAGNLDAQAGAFDFPWPYPVVVRAIE